MMQNQTYFTISHIISLLFYTENVAKVNFYCVLGDNFLSYNPENESKEF